MFHRLFYQSAQITLSLLLTAATLCSVAEAKDLRLATPLNSLAVRPITSAKMVRMQDYAIKSMKITRHNATNTLSLEAVITNAATTNSVGRYTVSSPGIVYKDEILDRTGRMWHMLTNVDKGSRDITLTLDSKYQIAESSERNNSCTIKVGTDDGVYQRRCF